MQRKMRRRGVSPPRRLFVLLWAAAVAHFSTRSGRITPPTASAASFLAPVLVRPLNGRDCRVSVRFGRFPARLVAVPGGFPSMSPSPTTREVSDEMLRLLQMKAVAVGKSTKNDSDSEINVLARKLIGSRSGFDPRVSIDGPFYASVHFIGDTPLWEKIGFTSNIFGGDNEDASGGGSGGRPNIKGQRYTLAAGVGGDEGPFVNYAEVLGEKLYLKAIGNFRDVGPVVGDGTGAAEMMDDDDDAGAPPKNPLGVLGSLFGFLQGNKGDEGSVRGGGGLLPTPYDYLATVTGGSVVLLNKFSFDFSIEGTGTTRVLYADERLRIFVSPKETNVTGGVLRKGPGGDAWESEGLIVVQVRADLVYPGWSVGDDL